jgi:succinate dehydrogenase / fumarate reductase, cytochrome b subunit
MTGRGIEVPGAAERAGHGPVRHRGPGPAPSGWLDPRGRTLGGRAFALNRLTGLGLVVYLYLHLCVLSLLLGGTSTWGSLLRIVTSVAFLGMDVVLLFVLLFHSLNGVRVALIGSGLAVEHQRMLFWAATAVGTIALTAAAIDLLGSA